MIIEERICLYKQSYLMERNNIHLKRHIIHLTRGATDNALMRMLEIETCTDRYFLLGERWQVMINP